MSHMIVYTEVFAGCLLTAAAIVFRVRQELVSNLKSRTKAGRHTHSNSPFRTK